LNRTNPFCLFSGTVVLLFSAALARADTIGVSNSQLIQDGVGQPTSYSIVRMANIPTLTYGLYQNSLGPAEQFSPRPLATMGEAPERATVGSGISAIGDSLRFPVLGGATPTSFRFTGPVALCETPPNPPPSPAPEPGTLVLLGSGLLVDAFYRHRRRWVHPRHFTSQH